MLYALKRLALGISLVALAPAIRLLADEFDESAAGMLRRSYV